LLFGFVLWGLDGFYNNLNSLVETGINKSFAPVQVMMLYKYLDVNGGLRMLRNRNLQFTNATCLNDPFDCHPGLLDFSNVPNDNLSRVWGKDRIALLKSNPHELLRGKAWVCSLSKVHNSLLMWSYYCNQHKGVCIGLDMTKARKYLSKIMGEIYYGAEEIEVQYKGIIERPDYFHDQGDFYRYQLGTKAKEWSHEQEVRLVLREPSRLFVPMQLPYVPKKGARVDWTELRAYPHIGGECFNSLFLGIDINLKKKSEIIEMARLCNPEIKIYQMIPDANAFKLRSELIQEDEIAALTTRCPSRPSLSFSSLKKILSKYFVSNRGEKSTRH